MDWWNLPGGFPTRQGLAGPFGAHEISPMVSGRLLQPRCRPAGLVDFEPPGSREAGAGKPGRIIGIFCCETPFAVLSSRKLCLPLGRDLREHERMDELQAGSRNTAPHPRRSSSPMSTGRACPQHGIGHQSESRQTCIPFFFREPSPLSESGSYKRAKERDTRKIGPEKELTLTSGPLEQGVEAVFSRAGIPSYFGLEDRILMNLSGHRLRRCVVERFVSGSQGGLASRLSNGESVISLSIP
jgi:hypothetical protein